MHESDEVRRGKTNRFPMALSAITKTSQKKLVSTACPRQDTTRKINDKSVTQNDAQFYASLHLSLHVSLVLFLQSLDSLGKKGLSDDTDWALSKTGPRRPWSSVAYLVLLEHLCVHKSCLLALQFECTLHSGKLINYSPLHPPLYIHLFFLTSVKNTCHIPPIHFLLSDAASIH